MLELRFRGWFQCRLATDPDPYDEPRGVSGYVHAYAGEPDLDRVIQFQKPTFTRSHGPALGVVVDQVLLDNRIVADSPLLGAKVSLSDSAKFEGRNGVIAEDGLEPIYPFELSVEKEKFALRRAVEPKNPDYPYPEYFAKGVEGGESIADIIRDATGIPGLRQAWSERLKALAIELEEARDGQRTAIEERMDFLRNNMGTTRFFGVWMRYSYPLSSTPVLNDPQGWLPRTPKSAEPWYADFWLGGWDADVLCGYCRGSLRLPSAGELNTAGLHPRRP